jgi:hypothetical protein
LGDGSGETTLFLLQSSRRIRADLPRSPAWIQPSCSYAPLQRFKPIRRIALSFQRSRSVLPRILVNAAPSGFPPGQPSAEPKLNGILSCGCAHFRVWPATPAVRSSPRAFSHRPLSWSFLSLRRLSTGESTRELPPACAPPTGFLTLSAAYSSPARPAMFQAGNALGILLSRGFPPPPGPGSSSLPGCPLGVCSSHPKKT